MTHIVGPAVDGIATLMGRCKEVSRGASEVASAAHRILRFLEPRDDPNAESLTGLDSPVSVLDDANRSLSCAFVDLKSIMEHLGVPQ